MKEGNLERLFKWIDFVRIVLYIIIASAVAVAVWCTKIQISLSELRSDEDNAQAAAAVYRVTRSDKDVIQEHRMSALETNVEWLKHGR